jgi:hypothetical protein
VQTQQGSKHARTFLSATRALYTGFPAGIFVDRLVKRLQETFRARVQWLIELCSGAHIWGRTQRCQNLAAERKRRRCLLGSALRLFWRHRWPPPNRHACLSAFSLTALDPFVDREWDEHAGYAMTGLSGANKQNMAVCILRCSIAQGSGEFEKVGEGGSPH